MKNIWTELNYWLNWSWFKYETLTSYDYNNPWFLYAIPFVPLIFVLRWLFHFRFRQKLEYALPDKNIKNDKTAILRLIPRIFMIICLILVLFALARPQKTNQKIDKWSEGIDIMIALDISESMLLEDFRPNRLEAAKKVAKKFVAGRISDRIGLVVFSGDAYSLCPLTTDYEMLEKHISDINHKLISKPGTAIGSAIGVAINRMVQSESKTKIIILLSDGESNAGSIDPITAAELASAHNIKLYSIAVGKEGKIPYGTDVFGNPQYVENTMNVTTLVKIAQIGEGKFFRASNNSALNQIFSKIDKYEKAEIKETRFKDTKDYYDIYLRWAVIAFLIWLFLKSTFLSNALED